MGITYKELFREKDRVYGFGPAGYFIGRFKKSDYSEAELLDLISGIDFSLGEAGEDISLEKKCKIVERSVAETHYTSWALSLIGMIFSLADRDRGGSSGRISSCPGSIRVVSVLL